MAVFILIHGAWHGGWCWERIVPLLSARGHRVLAPDLPGMGKDKKPLSEINLDVWVQFLCDLIKKQNEKVILVGHSRGGIVISQAAEYMANHIQCLIYLAAFLIPNGKSLLDIVHEDPQPPERLDLVFSPDKNTSTVTEKTICQRFYNMTDEKWIQRAISQMSAEPMIPFSTPLSLSEDHFGKIPRIYIECLQDKAVSIDLQRSMIKKLPCQSVVTLDTDHSPFFSAPEVLADKLINIDLS